ncbi:MAG TPA: hypothetical protein VEL76_14160 [Gemmataceae bacterium]|nr:hypothetical protein [Gemmataceae bacterium]
MKSIDRFDAYIVKRFYERDRIAAFRQFLLAIFAASEPSWHPCFDGRPDYHRINDEYPKSWVKARMHSYYFHRWNEHRDLFSDFKEIFELKNYLAQVDKDAHYDAIPSHGVISRIVSHQYPRGGGYLAEHIDPANPFALIQTIIQAADYGKDFETGGLYIRLSAESGPILLDPLTEMGDLVVASPAVRHGVLPIDPSSELDWRRSDGRWMILPVIIRSDYQADPATKPRMVEKAA